MTSPESYMIPSGIHPLTIRPRLDAEGREIPPPPPVMAVPEPPRPTPTAELKRGVSSVTLRKTIAEVDEAIPPLEEKLGVAVAEGDHYALQGLREELAELHRRRAEAVLALPHALRREAELAERQEHMPQMQAELKRIYVGSLRLNAALARARLRLNEVIAAHQQYWRANDQRTSRLRHEVTELGGDTSFISSLELIRNPDQLDAMADRLEAEAGGTA